MLLYNKALDPNHTLLRMVSIVNSIETNMIEMERLRIYDFLLSFPEHIATMNLGRKLMYKKKDFIKYKNCYSNYDPLTLFNSMQTIHKCALSNLVKLSILEETSSNNFLIDKESIPVNIIKIIQSEGSSIPSDALIFLTTQMTNLDLLGQKGIKNSSQLMDYKYDSV